MADGLKEKALARVLADIIPDPELWVEYDVLGKDWCETAACNCATGSRYRVMSAEYHGFTLDVGQCPECLTVYYWAGGVKPATG
jgi:hypothetical protein